MRAGAFPMNRLLLCAIVLMTACERGEGIDLRRWSLGAAPIDLPAHLPEAARPPAFVLTTTVELPPSLRGQRLTLAFARLGAPAALVVNGSEAQPLDADVRSVYRVAGPQSFRINATSGTLKLELTLANTWTQSA